MEINKNTWLSLCEILEPTVDQEENIESIHAELSNHGIIAHVDEPRDLSNIEEEYDSITIYEQVGLEIHKKVKNRLKTVISNTPDVCSVDLRHLVINKDHIHIVCEISHSVQEDEYNIFAKVTEIMEEYEGFIDSADDIAYGSINAHKSPNENDLWDFDGTVYKFTDEPYKYWSKGPDTDQPQNMDEWIDFVAENKNNRAVVKNRDNHTVHFHPSKFNIDYDHPYIDNWIEINNKVKEQFDINSYDTFDLRRIQFNPEYSKLVYSLIV